MLKYNNKIDATFGVILLLCGVVCTFILTGTLWYHYKLIRWASVFPSIKTNIWSIYVPYVLLLLSVLVVRHFLVHRKVHLLMYPVLLATVFYAFWHSFGWFRTPMHDLALSLGSHGRWGCSVVNSDGSHAYLIRDATVPWLLFVPIIVGTVVHAMLTRLPPFLQYRWFGTQSSGDLH